MSKHEVGGNGHVYAEHSEIERLDRRLDDQSHIFQQRVGEMEASWIRLEGHFGRLLGDGSATRSEVDTLRISVAERLHVMSTRLEDQISRLRLGVEENNRLLVLLVGSAK